MNSDNRTGLEIAVIGMSCHFPGSKNIWEFWENLKNGKELISFFDDNELRISGISEELLQNPNYIKAFGVLEGTEKFDADLFGYTPREAEIMDPQLKVLHECFWEALENSGYCSGIYKKPVGVYIGGATNYLWLSSLFSEQNGFSHEAMFLNNSQFFATRLSYRFNFNGPSITVQTACSSSLVATHLACQGLLNGECDIALAGGVSVTLPEKRGYVYQPGMILSSDGHCRAFDADADGTVGGNGVGVVVLKRLEDAINDNDYIYSIIKGSAVNNDGNKKVSFTAPSVEGQAEVIRVAQYMAEADPESISYVETHGTGTILGDPIEIEALKLAFNTNKRNFCALGSVKTNIGHLDNAAGIAGLIKTVLALDRKIIPKSLNFHQPNDKIDFTNSPFYVNNCLQEWKKSKYPLRAGVSSFGIGGTNAHVILEEAPQREPNSESLQWNIVTVSSKNLSSLDNLTIQLADFINSNTDVNLADAAYSLQVGRRCFKYRKMFVCSKNDELVKALAKSGTEGYFTAMNEGNKKIVFMFPGQGSQYINMGLELYKGVNTFRKELDHCADILKKLTGINIIDFLYPPASKINHAVLDADVPNNIYQTYIAQPVIFMFEYALAKLLIYWGIRPQAMIGHSIGEYVSAALSGVLTLDEALDIVIFRAKLMQKVQPGCMISVQLPESEVMPLLGENLSLAVVNSPSNCVVAGTEAAMTDFIEALDQKSIRHKKLNTSHAFHSFMLEPILDAFEEKMRSINFKRPQIPYISNVTGKWITDNEATNPRYWVDHMRNTVRFSQGVIELINQDGYHFVEVGPGRALCSLVKQHICETFQNLVISTVKVSEENISDTWLLFNSVGQLWTKGVEVDWIHFHEGEKRSRVPLPSYQFDRHLYSRITLQHTANSSEMLVSCENPKVNGKASISDRKTRMVSTPLSVNELEQRIINIYREVTGIEEIASDDDFFEMGGNSLNAVDVAARLQAICNVTLNNLFEYPKARDLATHLFYGKIDLNDRIEQLKEYYKYTRERLSNPGITESFERARYIYEKRVQKYRSLDLASKINYENILLTGSTGYLGAYLLYDLISETKSKLHLIIRGRDHEEVMHRLKLKLDFYFGSNYFEKVKNRIEVYNGDIAQKELGLASHTYESLRTEVDCIIHSAANVNHFGKYSDSYEVNVTGTANLIDFALVNSQIFFHYISTLAIASGDIKGERDVLFTEYDCDIAQNIPNNYSKTKFEAEKIIINAREKGLNSNIYRAGNIVYDSRTGKFQENILQNSLYSLIRSFIKLGAVPRMERDTDFSCVDYVSKAIITLFNREQLKNETFHIYNPNYKSISDILSLETLRLDMKVLKIDDFLDYFHVNGQNPDMIKYFYDIQLHLLGSELPDAADWGRTNFHLTCEKTSYLLERLGFTWNNIDEDSIKKLIHYCREVGFI